MKNTDYHFYHFLKDNNYPITYEDFSKNINSHPDYPSLLAYSETFSYLGVENLAAQVPKEEYENIPDTFIALIKESNDNKFVYVKKKSKNSVEVYSNKTKSNYSLDQFFSLWDGVILAIDENEAVIEKKTNTVKKTIYWIISIVFLLILILNNYSWLSILSIFLSILGFVFALLTSREELGFEDDQVQKICNSSENSSCNEVIKSAGGKIINSFSLSDLALAYFGSSFLLNMFISDFYLSFSLLILSILSVFVIGYSLYYQKFTVKRWCFLCLGIVSVLFVQCIISFLSYNNNFIYLPFILFGFLFLVLLSSWSLVKVFITRFFELRKIEVDFLKLKRNKKIFDALLTTSESVIIDNNINTIKKSPNSDIIGILSPSCGFCKKAFFNYKELIDKNVEVNLMFNINPDNPDNKYLKVCYFIINEFNLKGYSHTIQLLESWYKSSFEIDSWLKEKNYDAENIDTEKVYNQLKEMFVWCQDNTINYTPATIFKDKIYSTDLDISDLKFFIG
ncbi:Peptidase C39 family protein [Algoriella xinjiangensis]|uniref:Peptidase C39 family protein n=1 Tax=Algoriella xinjiangensis TaxID=684065 RepID=A0A1I4U6U8_9FLAO|nr:vitamin K epoxide reductase family protein [Algoriella xinjiangensis]SFM84570.1 Peptidase C39 family protein [Algoriella xinjiangensis]VDH17870.1 Predicted membrane protein [Algoriella xinjiangensis]